MTLRKILVGTDFSEAARGAVQRAAAIAAARDASLVVAHAIEPLWHRHPAPPPGALENARATATRLLRDECAGAAAMPLVLEGHADEQIVDAARAEAADLVVVGSHNPGSIERFLLGSVAENVVRAAEAPVLVCRGTGLGQFARILVATDFSEAAERALALALELAARRALVDVMHVVQLAPSVAGDASLVLDASLARALEHEARRRGAELLTRHDRAGVDMRFDIGLGAPRDGILRKVGEGTDLVALGTHGRRGFRRFLLGSVAAAIVRHAPCSVLITR